jgi:DNA-binding transcriptional MerR regulator
MDREWTLHELASESGVPERTIRFYISRGLLDPPLRGGRGATYGPAHLSRLQEIRRLQAKGMMLAEIAHLTSPAPLAEPDLESPSAWLHFDLAADVTVSVRADTNPWRARLIRSALRQFASLLQNTPPKGEDDERH